MKGKAVTARTDGASRGNPGPSGIGVVLEVDGEAVPIERFEYIGETTNNVAEYRALLLALSEAESLSPSSLTILSDSELLVRQLSGEYRVKSDLLKPLYREACRRLRRFPGARILHVERGENRDADRLANRAIDDHLQKA
ncbi:MAG: ribonuclease HI family protein [Candidatus Deferrimicrobiaceae bacterium]